MVRNSTILKSLKSLILKRKYNERRRILKSIKQKIYFHREKEDNWDLEEKLEKKKFNTDNILSLGSEITVEVELFEDGTNKVISFEGIDVSDKNISI